MPATRYTYKVRDNGGALIEGSLEADDEALVAMRLREMGYTPIQIQAKPTKAMKKELHVPGFGGRVPLKELAVTSRQFATLIGAGLTLLRALTILGEQTENPKLRQVLTDVRNEVERGVSLSQALGAHPKVFNKLYLSMVRSGETSGGLDAALVSLATTIEKQVALRGKIKSAMAYPVAALCMVSLIGAIMLLFIVPQFKSIFKTLGGKLPLPTQILVDVSNILVTFLPIVVVLLGVAIYLLRRAIKTPQGKVVWDTFKLKVPVFGSLLRKTALSRFATTLSALLQAGVPVLESLEITNDTVDNVVLSRGILAIRDGVRNGEPITRSLTGHAVFPPMVVQMMSVGEETGGLDTMLHKAATFIDGEIERMVESLTALLEPLLIMVLGSVVGAMVICLYLPMFDVNKLVGSGG